MASPIPPAAPVTRATLSATATMYVPPVARRCSGLLADIWSLFGRRTLTCGRAARVQGKEVVDHAAVDLEGGHPGVQPGSTGIGEGIQAPGRARLPRLPGREQQPILFELAQRAVERARVGAEEAQALEVLFNQVSMSGAPQRDGEQDAGDEDVARRPVDR